jgi:hypothetical protein
VCLRKRGPADDPGALKSDEMRFWLAVVMESLDLERSVELHACLVELCYVPVCKARRRPRLKFCPRVTPPGKVAQAKTAITTHHMHLRSIRRLQHVLVPGISAV